MWSQDIYRKALLFAAKYHNSQKLTDSELPYLVHLTNVCMETIAVLQNQTNLNENLAIQCALLHDTLEDTEATFNMIVEHFGGHVADGVLALTKDTSLPKELRIKDSLNRIKKQPLEIWIVKMADRITNLQPPPSSWNKEKIRKYRNDAIFIYENLRNASPYLEKRLRKKISFYGRFIL